METDVNWIYYSDHFTTYANTELCCTLETNIMLYLNYISTKVNNKQEETKTQGKNIYNTHS